MPEVHALSALSMVLKVMRSGVMLCERICCKIARESLKTALLRIEHEAATCTRALKVMMEGAILKAFA